MTISFTSFVDEFLKIAGFDEKEPGVKAAQDEGFGESDYSGGLYGPRFKQQSGAPPFSSPPFKTAGPPSQKKKQAGMNRLLRVQERLVKDLKGKPVQEAAMDLGLSGMSGGEGARNAFQKAFSKLRRRTSNFKGDYEVAAKPQLDNLEQKQIKMIKKHWNLPTKEASPKTIGNPRVTAPPGPSIAQISKPKGYGRPIPGATKVAAIPLKTLANPKFEKFFEGVSKNKVKPFWAPKGKPLVIPGITPGT